MPSDRHSGIQGSGKGAPKRGYCAFRRTPFRRLSQPWRAWRDWIDPKTRWQGQNWYAARMPHRYKASSWHDRLVLMQKELKSSGSETLFWVCCTPNSHECAGAPTRKIARGSSAASRSMRWAWYLCSRRAWRPGTWCSRSISVFCPCLSSYGRCPAGLRSRHCS